MNLEARQQRINEALAAIRKINNDLQASTALGSAEWHRHETLDDRLHDVESMVEELEMIVESHIEDRCKASSLLISDGIKQAIAKAPLLGESEGFAQECAMQYGGALLGDDHIVFKLTDLTNMMGVLGYSTDTGALAERIESSIASLRKRIGDPALIKLGGGISMEVRALNDRRVLVSCEGKGDVVVHYHAAGMDLKVHAEKDFQPYHRVSFSNAEIDEFGA